MIGGQLPVQEGKSFNVRLKDGGFMGAQFTHESPLKIGQLRAAVRADQANL
jgi:hypothetical protein